MKTYRKTDVEFHREGYAGPGVPAVNVKVPFGRTTLPLDLGGYSDDGGVTVHTMRTDPEFTWDWIDEHLTDDDLNFAFEFACMAGWEYLRDEAKEIFGDHVTVYSEGRSSGWAIVNGLKDFDSWDAVDLGRWRRFALIARAYADDIPRQMVEGIYMNEWEHRNDVPPTPSAVIADALMGADIDPLTASSHSDIAVKALRDAGLLPKETA